MLVEADRIFPRETGGVLIGYWSASRDEVAICRASGPGSGAIHMEHVFIPDSEYQESEIARIYEESGRVHTYLGDWHTHPREAVYLSPKDELALRRIAGFSEARAPMPIMAVLGGGEPEWFIGAWRYAPRGARRFTRKGKISSLEISIY